MDSRMLYVLTVCFVTLIGFTIVQQVFSFHQHLRHPVSAISIIDNEDGFHDSTTVLFGAFEMMASKSSGERRQIQFSSYNVSSYCSCERMTSRASQPHRPCNLLRYNFGDSNLNDTGVMIFEGPLNWRDQEQIHLICEHPEQEFLVFTFVSIGESFSAFTDKIHRMGRVASSRLVDSYFSEKPTEWIHCNFFTSILLSKTEYFKQHQPDNIEINSFESSTANVYGGQTRVVFAWREGYTTRIDKFTDRDIWSFALLLCSIVLGLERCHAMLHRARAQTKALEEKGRLQSVTNCPQNAESKA